MLHCVEHVGQHRPGLSHRMHCYLLDEWLHHQCCLQAGRWRDGKLEVPLELWQCALATEGAGEAAAAAKR